MSVSFHPSCTFVSQSGTKWLHVEVPQRVQLAKTGYCWGSPWSPRFHGLHKIETRHMTQCTLNWPNQHVGIRQVVDLGGPWETHQTLKVGVPRFESAELVSTCHKLGLCGPKPANLIQASDTGAPCPWDQECQRQKLSPLLHVSLFCPKP